MAEIKVTLLAIEKLMDYAASGEGTVAGPMLGNWKAHKEVKAKITSALYGLE